MDQKIAATGIMTAGLLDLPYLKSDSTFDSIYPSWIRALSEKHWTPLDVAKEAGDFLASPGARVLDIGSGAGKFCIIAGLYHPEAAFYGIEHRQSLAEAAEQARLQTGVSNVRLSLGNFSSLSDDDYDHFYFYNSFCEQVQPWGRIDGTVPTSMALYRQYQAHFHYMLSGKPPGTRLATYHTPSSEIPRGYRMVHNAYKKYMKFWIKEG